MTDNETLLLFFQKYLTCFEECFEYLVLSLCCRGTEKGMLQNHQDYSQVQLQIIQKKIGFQTSGFKTFHLFYIIVPQAAPINSHIYYSTC